MLNQEHVCVTLTVMWQSLQTEPSWATRAYNRRRTCCKLVKGSPMAMVRPYPAAMPKITAMMPVIARLVRVKTRSRLHT